MGSTLDLGQRIELVAMDPHFASITIGLYLSAAGGTPEYLVHSYSVLPGAGQRLRDVTAAMSILGGLAEYEGRLRFPCGAKHQLAVRRTFLEACKISLDQAIEPRPMRVFDKKLNHSVYAHSLGDGVYELASENPSEAAAGRLESIVGGMRKLAEVRFVAGEPFRFEFDCGQPHNALVGLLLPRALNLRAELREEEMAAARGTLVSPSAQK